jgi:hypothetical protein
MSIIETSIPTTEFSTPMREGPTSKWIAAEKSVLIVGLAALAMLGLARVVYEPSVHDKELATRAAMAAEHAKVCDQLGKPADAPDRDNCLKLLDGVYTTHQKAFIADNSEI